jgi:hypothetical protein
MMIFFVEVSANRVDQGFRHAYFNDMLFLFLSHRTQKIPLNSSVFDSDSKINIYPFKFNSYKSLIHPVEVPIKQMTMGRGM